MKKINYTINISLTLIAILLLSFILYVLYCTYLSPRPISLNSIITTTNLQTIKTNGQHLPNEIQLKNKLKQQYHNLIVDKIKIKIKDNNTATIISADPKVYTNSININYIVDKSLENEIDLNKSYYPNLTLIKQRGYKGLWINNNQPTTDEKNLTNAFLSSYQYFNLPFYEKQEFTSFQELLIFLNQNIKTSWEYIVKNFCNTYKEQLKELILLFYNILANIFNKKNINNILRKIKVENLNNVWGYANLVNKQVALNSTTLKCDYANIAINEWTSGFKTSNSIFKTLFHELGHIINSYYEYKNINIINNLKEFLVKKINNSHNLDNEKILKLFHFSEYSFENEYEFFAEGFTYWFLASDELKTKAWEFWHEFLTLYLPKKIN
ncbi:hypothetical protein GL981_11760 (plasmid) [Spiroplasma citri]|uniref:Transmembrane protein n=2 Tax=Spiroplasma citri TaxID=2133 RepID=A0AAJ4ELC6_SPICI|nr:hypothetical protein GL298_10970 [Spiroplasma citri]QIA71974.1 hypothetical protein GL981_11760 [Spiroplasma citri]QJU62667.1 hypothetical protein HHA36_10135 [Spiroplasma citri]